MAIFTFTDAYISINGVLLSDHGNQVKITDSRDNKDATTFGAVNKASLKGLGDAQIDITLLQDFAAGKVHATLQPLIGSTTPVAVEIRPTSGARSATNPAALLSQALMFDYNMLDASIGDIPATTATFMNAVSSAGMTYPTS